MYRGSIKIWERKSESCSVMSDSLQLGRPEFWSRSLFPSPGNLPNPGLPHCRWILDQLRHQESPTILEWVIYPSSSGSSQPRNRTRVSCIAGRFFTSWATREAQKYENQGQMQQLTPLCHPELRNWILAQSPRRRKVIHRTIRKGDVC